MSTMKFLPADKFAKIPELKYKMNKNIFKNTTVLVWLVINVPKSNPTVLPETDNITEIMSQDEKFSIESSLNCTHTKAASEYIRG